MVNRNIDLYLIFDLICTGSIGEVPVLLAKPQTYMNFSGESVSFSLYIIARFFMINTHTHTY